MSYHSELHYQRANTSPREVWEGFSETEDGFAPLSGDALAECEADALDAYYQAIDERAWRIAENARLEIEGLRRMAAYNVNDPPF